MNLAAKQERDPRLWTADQFLEFAMTRPDEERWQLIDGLAIMMVPPNKVHQRIGLNLLRLLNDHFETTRSDLLAYYEMGVRIPGNIDFNPMPDVLVVEAEATYERYASTFFLAAEVLSPSNKAELIERKLELYRTHPENLYCLIVDQDSVHVELYAQESGWTRAEHTSLDDELALPAFGFRARLSAIYAGTPLAR